METFVLIQIAYLIAASLFIIGLHQLNSPTTASRGNRLAALGMSIAVGATLFDQSVLNHELILTGILIGGVIGAIGAQRVPMTDMPQMVGLLNGFGGGASALVAIGEYWRLIGVPTSLSLDLLLTTLLGTLIGGVTFTGSLMAYGKLQGIIFGPPLLFPLQRFCNSFLLFLFVAGGVYLLFSPGHFLFFLSLFILALLLGVLIVLPIGAADMPVVISLLNSCSGLAASAAGFVIKNDLLIIAGALVGASGFILTQIMCRAMNRSLVNVLFGALGTDQTMEIPLTPQREKIVHSIDVEEAAMVLAYARSLIIVPGYGMAVAQAQHVVRNLADLLKNRGITVKYAIHPVAGRMPGHMNVLLAEANVPYTELYDMDDINPEFEHTDVALVIGANDVVNPAARYNQESPLYGMPILDVDKARQVIVIKRSLKPGFAGVDNELFYEKKTLMLFGSAQEVVTALVNEIKRL